MCADLTLLQHDFAAALVRLDAGYPVNGVFKGNPAINRERFALYRGNSIAIWQQSCANAYPVLQQLVGNVFFDELARAYGQEYPSLSGNLSEYGAGLAQFISGLDNCRAYPYLSAVAELEWQVHQAYFLAHHPPATLAQLGAFPADQLADLRFTLQPGSALLTSDWATAEIWQAHQLADFSMPEQLCQTTHCLIRRPDWEASWQVQVSRISAASYAALQALSKGATLGSALELALACDPEFAIQTELADWFNQQLFCNITL